METEDDTFNVLRKQPFSVLLERLDAIPGPEWCEFTGKQQDDWFEAQGWTYIEYIRTYHKYTRK